jgi:phenylacetaldehyde dehydrogenase
VESGVYDEVVEGVSAAAAGMTVGPGLEPGSEIGPLVSAEQLERVTGYLSVGQEEGARTAAGGGRIDRPGYFVQPTVLADTRNEMRIVQEEIFGPVLVAQPFERTDDIEPLANDSPYGLAAAIWTKDITKAHRTAAALQAGTVWINTYNIYDAALPFGGYKQSGWGREMGEDVLGLYTETKSICVGLD